MAENKGTFDVHVKFAYGCYGTQAATAGVITETGSFERWNKVGKRVHHVPADRQDHETARAGEELGRVQDLARKSEPENARRKNIRVHLGNVALVIGDLALHVHGWPVFRFQPVSVTHLPCYTHAACLSNI